jgi:hypothetical protein
VKPFTAGTDRLAYSPHIIPEAVLDRSPPLSIIHHILETLQSSLKELGSTHTPEELEAIGVLVHDAMAGRSRLFHSHEHIFELSRDASAVQTVASYFHDLIYLQVDQGLPKVAEARVGAYLVQEGAAYKLKSVDPKDIAEQLAFGVFGFEPGATVSIYGGLNEFLSGLVAARELAAILTPQCLLGVLACIEATQPFRKPDAQGRSPMDRLHDRLTKLNVQLGLKLTAKALAQIVAEAVWLANKDVQNFAFADVGRFLDNTWKLLPETNASLATGFYTVREYRTALQKMEGFLATLDPAVVFQSFAGVPTAAKMDKLRSAAQRNLTLSVAYLQAKLLTIAMLEALSLLSGGDAPLSLFAGGLTEPGKRKPRRLEDYLPPLRKKPVKGCDRSVMKLLELGRTSETRFDLRNSPIAAYVYRELGAPGVQASLQPAKDFFAGKLQPDAFLSAIPSAAVVSTLAHATARLVSTRTATLAKISETFAAMAGATQE